MPIKHVNGVDIYYEETGRGFPLVWSHEFGGDYRAWEAQVRYVSRRYRVITYNHRGYAPSSVLKQADADTHEHLIENLHHLLRGLGIARAHVEGLSLGGNVALHFGLAHPEMTKSLIVAGCGSGTVNRETFLEQTAANADALETRGIEALVQNFENLRHAQGVPRQGPTRLAGVSQLRTIFELEAKLKTLTVPTLVMVGDQDEPCIEPALFMRSRIPHAGLVMLPVSAHTINIEEPARFNEHVAEFLTAVDSGRWGTWSA